MRPRNYPDAGNSAVSVAHAPAGRLRKPWRSAWRCGSRESAALEVAVSKQPCFWDAEDRLKEISAKGDPLETLAEAVDFKRFKPTLEKAAGRPPQPEGRPPLRSTGPEIQDAGASEPPRAVARSDREDGVRPAGLDALLRPRDVRQGSGREHAPGFPRGAGQGRRAG